MNRYKEFKNKNIDNIIQQNKDDYKILVTSFIKNINESL